ncbi:Short-chain dehydrogenase [Reichenbachiella faecimaris]|uniref:Short-chain dehydrogenase n=1 Tax=Reichenbachiella faecimaris TaxID=692418 RepID=A0A1W2GKL8_REIFA|nr:SDR family oxidoreductase [Reichenbachiella faecimaris]SMD37205.1 Short-chain dehydrogenase [Reichenbachiella faecimaris]
MTKGNILITGASTGIGAACAKKFVDEGYTVYGSVRKQEDANRLTEALGESFQPLFFDVTNESAIRKAAEELTSQVEGQGLKLLINNAGIAVTGAVELLDVEAYRKQYEVNYFGLIAVTQAFLPLLGAKRNYESTPGKIINMSSIASKRAMPFMTPYSSSKAALDSFTEGLRRELLIYGIDAVTINPGPIRTPIWDKLDVNFDDVKGTVYESILKRFIKLVNKEASEAIDSDDFARRVFKTFINKSPKVSNVVIKNKFLKYNLVSLVPARKVDSFIKKVLKI